MEITTAITQLNKERDFLGLECWNYYKTLKNTATWSIANALCEPIVCLCAKQAKCLLLLQNNNNPKFDNKSFWVYNIVLFS